MLRRLHSTYIHFGLVGLLGLGCAAQPDAEEEGPSPAARAAANEALDAMQADAQVQELLGGLAVAGCVPNLSRGDLLPLIDSPESVDSITIFSRRECESPLVATGVLARVQDGAVEYASAFILPQRERLDGSDPYPDYANFVGFIAYGGELQQFDSYRVWRDEVHNPATARLATGPEAGVPSASPAVAGSDERIAGERSSEFEPLEGETCTECVARVVAADATDRAGAARMCEQANAELQAQADQQNQTTEWADYLLGVATGEGGPVATSDPSAGAASFSDCNEGAGEALTAAQAQSSDDCSGSCVEEAQCDPAGGVGCTYEEVANEQLYCEPAVECVRVREDADPDRYYVCATAADGEFIADGAGYVGNPNPSGTCE